MKNLILCSLLLSVSFVLRAETIICEGNDGSSEKFTVVLENPWPSQEAVITISGGYLSQPRVFSPVQSFNGLYTAPGLALHFKHQYGCIREAVIVTELSDLQGAGYMEVYNLGTCRGGGLPDDICLGK